MARCCNDFSRTDLLRRAAAEAGRGLPAIESGMPLPAGTGLDRRSFLARTRRARARRLRQRGVPAACVRGGHRRRDGGRPAEGARLRLPRRRRRLALDALPGRRPALPQAAPAPGAADVGRASVQRGSPAPLAPVTGRARAAARRGQGRGDGRRRLHRAGPVALHLAALLGGRRDERAAAHRLARPLPRPQRLARQPATGPLARLAPAAGARDGEDAGRLDRRPRPVRLLDAQRLGRRREADARRDRRARPPADERRRGARAGDVGGAPVGPAAPAAAPLHAQERPARLHEPRRVPEGRRRVPPPARGSRRDARRRPAGSRRRALGPGDVRHARRPAAGARRRPAS